MIDPNISLEEVHLFNPDTIMEVLGIEYTGLGADFLEGKMPVDHRTHQPMGILHGGASMVLAETLGSAASTLALKGTNNYAVGLEINGNHLKAVRSGFVHGRAQAIHIGRKTHIWSIEIKDDDGNLVCTSRITMMILEGK